MMEFFKWKESFNIGVEEIDRQHRSFLENLNACYEHLLEGKQSTPDFDLITRLKDYAATHFRYEEDLLHSSGFPQIKQHETQHRFFELQVAELEVARSGEKERATESILPFLRDWFLNHILQQDKKIVHYLRSPE
jgi:hemerythrin